MSAALAETIDRIEQTEASDREEYGRLVADLAENRHVDPAHLRGVLAVLRVSHDTLRADVERRASRLAAAKLLVELPGRKEARATATRELARVTAFATVACDARLAELDALRSAAIDERDARIAAAEKVATEAAAKCAECNAAADMLAQTAPAEAWALLTHLRSDRAAVARKASEYRDIIRDADLRVRRAAEPIPDRDPRDIVGPTQRAADRIARGEREEYGRTVAAHQAQRRAAAVESLAPLEARLAEIDAEIADAEASLLVP